MTLALILFFTGCAAPKNETKTPKNQSTTATTDDATDDKTNDNAVSAPQYDEKVPLFVCQDRADIEGDRDTYYYYNYKGELLENAVMPNVGFFGNNSLAPALDPATEKIGFVNKSGVFVIEPQWDDAAAFSDDGIALVILEEDDGTEWGREKYGFINEQGEYIVPCIYDTATSFYPNGVAIIGVEGEVEYTAIDENGVYYTYTDKGKKLGIIDITGKVLVEPKYTHIEQITGKYICCSTETTQAVYDLSGNVIVDENDCYIDETHAYTYELRDGELYRLTREQLITGPKTAENSGDYYKYSALSKYDGKEFVIVIIDVNTPVICSERVATTSTGYGYGVRRGEEIVIPFQYDRIVQYNSFYVAIKYKNGNKAEQVLDIYNQNFEKTAENLDYEFAYRTQPYGSNMILPDGYFEVCYYDEDIRENLSGIIDSSGKIIVPLLYYRTIKLFAYEAIGKFTY